MFSIQGHIDRPRADEISRAHRVPIAGWVYLGADRQADLRAIHVTATDGTSAGRTRIFFDRPEVTAHLGLALPTAAAFELHAALPDGYQPGGGECELILALEVRGEPALVPWQTVRCTLRADDLWGRQHFHVLRPSVETLLHREDVYSSGPSSRAVNGEIFALLLRYLPAGGRVLDVGCGTGPFGPPLMEKGFDWHGIEVKDEDCREMAESGLPHQQVVPGEPLPFGDGAFDGGMCIEVLEHIPDPDGFLAEVSRVVRGRTVFSVPNFEPVPLLSHKHVIPHHMLEADHKNFFTRFSLAALLRRHFRDAQVMDYAHLPLGTHVDELLPYHLLAIADNSL